MFSTAGERDGVRRAEAASPTRFRIVSRALRPRIPFEGIGPVIRFVGGVWLEPVALADAIEFAAIERGFDGLADELSAGPLFGGGDLFELGHRFVVELDEDALHIDEYIEELAG